jgi:carboxypeptidase Taq
MDTRFQELRARWIEIDELNRVADVLAWDQETYMPPGGATARARQLGTVRRLAHERLTDPALGRLLDVLRPYEESLPYDSDEAAMLRVARRNYEKARQVPAAFMAELESFSAESYQVWTQARAENDFPAMAPYLERMIDYSRRFADFFPGYESPADPLLDYFSAETMTAREIGALFAKLREQLVPLVQAVVAQPPPDDAFLFRHYPEPEQWAFGLEVAERMGYDLERGRQDKTHHPFTTYFSWGDVRITIRVDEQDLREALYSTVHEGGHALHAQGLRQDLEGSPLDGETSSGLDESQSRLWENQVGHSLAFWEFYYPRLQAVFPTQLSSVPLEAFYRAINKVTPNPFRLQADELTYDLHIMLRFDLEQDLLAGRLAVRDLPEAWRERLRADLGVSPRDDREGVLQDVHWYDFAFGAGFAGYTLGNLLAAQFYEAALRAHPEIPEEMRQGRFSTLLGWLQDQIYQHGCKYPTAELVERVAGGPLRIEPYVQYLRAKFGELYEL